MKNGHSIIPLIFTLAVSASCGRLDFRGLISPECAPVDKRFSQSMEYNSAHGYSRLTAQSDEYRVYAFADFHADCTTRNLDGFVKIVTGDGECIPAALFLGDMVGIKGDRPRKLFFDATAPLADKCRLFITPGNHDLYFGEWPAFLALIHTATYWFEVECPSAKDLYICLDSAGGTLGYDQRLWLESVLKEKSGQYRHLTIFTHTNFFRRYGNNGDISNYALEETYDLTSLFSRYGVKLVMTGHDHAKEDTVFGGVRYVSVPTLMDNDPKSGYCLCHIGKKIDIEFCSI